MARPPAPDLRHTAAERALMGQTGGVMWLLAGLVLIFGGLTAEGAAGHRGVVVGIALGGVLYGVLSIRSILPWSRLGPRVHLLAIATTLPLAGLLTWATGGPAGFGVPLVIMPLFFTAYFYPPRIAWPLVGLLLGSLGLAQVLAPAAGGFQPARALALTVSCATVTAVVLELKRRLVEAERRQRSMALQDPLTGLANRRAFDDALQDEVERALPAMRGRRGGDERACALLFVDLDHFKAINDAYGHQAGDRALRSVAAACTSVVRPSDTLARIGGDEFAIVAPAAGRAGAERLAADLADAVGRALPVQDGADPIAATVSWALLGRDGADAEALMRAADSRLHDMKRSRASFA